MRATPDDRSDRPLLEQTVRTALWDAHCILILRDNRSSYLHPDVTRSLFAGTDHLTARQLLLILLPKGQVEEMGAVPDSARRQEKHFRSASRGERGLRLDTVLNHCLDLLGSGQIKNSDMVRAWMFALIHAGALIVMQEASPDLISRMDDSPDQIELALHVLVPAVYNELSTLLTEQMQAAQQLSGKGVPRGHAAVFLNFAADAVLKEIGMRRPMLATLGRLVEILYPEFDAYGDPFTLDDGS